MNWILSPSSRGGGRGGGGRGGGGGQLEGPGAPAQGEREVPEVI